MEGKTSPNGSRAALVAAREVPSSARWMVSQRYLGLSCGHHRDACTGSDRGRGCRVLELELELELELRCCCAALACRRMQLTLVKSCGGGGGNNVSLGDRQTKFVV